LVDCLDLKEIASLIETGAYAKEARRIVRAVRLTMTLRRKLKASVLSAFLNFALSAGSEPFNRLISYLPKVIYWDFLVDRVILVFFIVDLISFGEWEWKNNEGFWLLDHLKGKNRIFHWLIIYAFEVFGLFLVLFVEIKC
jgi:hypothetical protein